MSRTNGGSRASKIDKRDFDANRPLLTQRDGPGDSRPTSREGDGTSIFSDVVDELVEQDRRLMRREMVRATSFIWAVLSAYASYSSIEILT